MQNLFTTFNIKSEYAKGAITASILFVITLLSISAFTLTGVVAGKFITNHNFAVAKYAGEVSYRADDVDDIYPWVLDTEGFEHNFFNQKGAYTFYPFSRYEPRDGTFLQVFEVKLYNSKTSRLHLLRLIW